jgi:hypothetical protein
MVKRNKVEGVFVTKSDLLARIVHSYLGYFRGDSMLQIKNYTKKTFNQPDERRDFQSHGRLDLLAFEGGVSIGKGTLEPGWKWSNDVKSIAGTESCEAPHTGYCISGSMTIRMNDGKEFQIKAGDAFQIPPGHDAWVTGNENCVMLDFTGYEQYAKKKDSGKQVA